MKKAKKWFAAALVLCMVLHLSGCGAGGGDDGGSKKEEPESEKKTIGCVLLTREHVFWNMMEKAIQKEADANGYEVIFSDGQQDSDTQFSQVQDFITQKVDAIILSPASSSGSAAAISMADEAGIPVFTLNCTSDGEPVCHVGTNEILGGKLAGEYAAKLLNGAGNTAIITYEEIEPCVQRAQGFEEALKEYPDMKILTTGNYAGDASKAANITQDFITQYPDLDLIFAVGDPAAVGALNTIKAADSDIRIIGYDGNPEGIEAIKSETDGKVWIADVAQDPDGQGKAVVEAIKKHFEGEEIDKTSLIDPYIIDADYIKANNL